MALVGKLITYVEINSHASVFHDILRHRPHDVASICPDKVHGCDILDGQPGAVGSIICWSYTHEGKKSIAKERIEEIDEANHKIVLKVIEGDLVEGLYKSLKIIFHVEPKGDLQLATWTFEFEKVSTSVPYPTSFMDYLVNLTREVDDHKSN